MSFATMKAARNQGFDDLQQELEKAEGGKKGFDDDRFYYPDRDKLGNANAVIRFLPTAEGDTLPMMKFFSHSKKFDGGWYIEECPTTIGEKCPVCEANDVLWNSGKEGQAAVRDNRKRKMRYVANIIVVKDPANPDNEGKRFLFQFGYKIQAMIKEAMAGIKDELEPENDVPPCNIWDFWEGKNFSLRIAKVENQTNYDKSSFAKKATPLHTFNAEGKAAKMSDEDLETLWNSQYKLTADYADKVEYKKYDDLNERFMKVTNATPKSQSAESMAKAGDKAVTADSPSKSKDPEPSTSAQGAGESEDSFFDNL